jgi:flagellar biosynthetic protein FliR
MDALGRALAGPDAILDQRVVLTVFVLFCRVGSCLMIAPGISISQIPAQVRLLVALAATLTLAPLLIDQAAPRIPGDDPIGMLRLIAFESAVGGVIGLLGRIFFMALETLAVGAATMLGFASPFGLEFEANQALPPLATLIVMGATASLFALDLHRELLRGLLASYDAIPLGTEFSPQHALRQVGDVLGQSSLLVLRICSPFFIYATIVNLAMALINRLTPQVAVFYIATPFVAMGGLFLLYFTMKPLIADFILGFGAWLVTG